jgi:hypothetical protein
MSLPDLDQLDQLHQSTTPESLSPEHTGELYALNNAWIFAIHDAWPVISAELRLLREDRETLAHKIIKLGFATGHGDTLMDLIEEWKWQLEERASLEAFERAAQICRELALGPVGIREGALLCAKAIDALPRRR